MDDFTPEQKKAIGEYVKVQLERNRLSQAKIARSRGCSATAVHTVVWQIDPLHVKLTKLKNYMSEKLGYGDWAELCAEALAGEEEVI